MLISRQVKFQPPAPRKFSPIEHAAAFAAGCVSLAKETVHLGQLAIAAAHDPSPLSLREKIHRLDMREYALGERMRVKYSHPAPPLGDKSPLKDLPAAHLKRPLMMVPGWDMAHDRFLTITEKLTKDGENGQTFYIKEGQFYSDRDCNHRVPERDVPKDSKVFVSVFRDISEAPQDTAPQLAVNMQALERVTGEGKPDLFAYSQGGLAVRRYLDRTHDEVGRFMMLGTPNYGAGLAAVSTFLYDAQDKGYSVDWLLRENHLTPADERSMRHLDPHSVELTDLNSRWDQQMALTEGAIVVGAEDHDTVHWGWPATEPGDAMVEKEHLAPPGVEPIILGKAEWTDHVNLPYNAQAYQVMHDHFGW